MEQDDDKGLWFPSTVVDRIHEESTIKCLTRDSQPERHGSKRPALFDVTPGEDAGMA